MSDKDLASIIYNEQLEVHMLYLGEATAVLGEFDRWCDLIHSRALLLYQKAGFRPYKREEKTFENPRSGKIL